MTYRETTAERLLQLRNKYNLTQKELAEKVDTSPQNIDLYESGKRKINVEILGKIADVFNVSTDY
ncbi:MAG: helix-turn-helix domain-containing protein, partial [Ruminococcus sp.]|nr:helix-turn-helix domain-containing protein [Ruminococcus sp.]